ncbi:trichohyalin isoform X1 [Drosophila kikkawai]|uniref:Trichohyalin isoform X1 n=1 Tax=Drosophila kikkawai TaxID=30033 RepID=A0A6P4IYB6_DROKI|nr:trichohyalin isoform X1 [Drosophila kikkawai]XP_017028234.1 trichohyalin isoform X1 [Drosophila kikkawai]XP_041631355.1 trichohyalin isoform X1 [Drosophila kikkawai]
MAAEETALTGVGELLFSLLITYFGALEFAYVTRHLYHWTFRHPEASALDAAADSEELPRMRERLDKEIKEAAEREALAGTNVMQDGVMYSKGFRVDPAGEKREALAAELERQQQIEAETRRQLAEAEARLAEERQRAKRQEEEAEEQQKKLIEAERQREREQAEKEREAEEQQRKQREIEEKERQENERKLIEAEREREENERRLHLAEEQREREENERRLVAAERLREQAEAEAERQREQAEAERLREQEEAERQRVLAEAEAAEAERRIFEAEIQREREEADDEEEQTQRDAEIVERLLAAERERKMSATESELEEEAAFAEQSRRLISSRSDLEQKQRMIEENARRFMEAEEEMVMLQQRQLMARNSKEEADEYAGMEPVVEEPCVKKVAPPRFQEPDEPMMVHKVKTQFGQGSSSEEPYLTKSKTLTFPGVSDDGSSVEPISSQQSSSFSTDEVNRAEGERPEPEGEDQIPDVQYTEDYLRSLDGIKNRPLVREDGSGRRRAFKKRRSSGSSNSSRDSRASRDEELKMFTSLEEEELRHGDREDYNPIKYTSEPTLRVKSHHRRHKRSPAKDVKPPSEASGSLEMLGEESTNPWGEVVPEHYKDTEFWKREKALSIDEEEVEMEKPSRGEDVEDEATNEPKSSSFEEATEAQNEEAVAALKQQHSKEQVEAEREKDNSQTTEASDSNKANLQTSSATEEQSRGGSPGLRRSPRIDEMDHYEERWSASQEQQPEQQQQANATPHTPVINVQQPDTAPWRDQYGLLMEGLSDFYDFTASVNPSRSRSTSRNPSPVPKNVANRMDVDAERSLEVYDDTQEGLMAGELNCESVLQLLESNLNGNEASNDQPLQVQTVADDARNGNAAVSMVYEPLEGATLNAPQGDRGREPSVERTRSRSRSRSPLPTSENLEKSISKRRERLIRQNDELAERLSHSGSEGSMEIEINGNGRLSPQQEIILPQPVIEINEMADKPMEDAKPSHEEMRLFVETLRAERNAQSRSRSRSRSRSPLPTADNIQKSLESRRLKRIQHNDEIFEKLHEQMNSPEIIIETASPPSSPLPLPTISIEISEPPPEETEAEPEDTPESMARLFEKLRLNRVRSHSRSRSRSPLPTAANLEQSLQKRREKLIAQNDQFFEALQERARTPEPETRMTVEYVYEFVHEKDEHIVEGRDMRSLSPSRSPSPSKNVEVDDFHLMLNLEGSELRTLRKNSEELESVLAASVRQRELDLEALEKLNSANEEIELRVLSPTDSELERVAAMTREMAAPDLERTVSEVARDLQDELVASGFKRSTYVGESLDLGSDQFQDLRREAALFQRSRSPSPRMTFEQAREQAAAQRELQAAILDSITDNRLGAKPKTYSEERAAAGCQEISAAQLDDLRHRTAEFQRSRSQSRSPLREDGLTQLRDIDAEAAKRELQDQVLDRLAASSGNFESFSRHLNADFLDSERRASDSALMGDMDPEEYHHFRRYSLAQEQPVEEYPSDDYVYISQIEVRTLTGTRTWLKEDFYPQDADNYSDSKGQVVDQDSWARAVLAAEAEAAEFDATNAIYSYDIVGDHENLDQERSSSNDSEDERQTVVEIDEDDEDEYEFELDEGISDNNERTQPTDESHHDTSECEEAERNADRYANRGAQDWEEVEDVEDFLDYSDGAVGGATPYSDPDSFIEQIYNEAIKNRKQSGILRDYETMVQEQLPSDQSESEKEKSGSESERYALWAKTRELERSSSRTRHTDVDIALGLVPETERRESEMRYLGDAHVAARQSTRLRTRYGYNPNLDVGAVDDDIEVDLNYTPKREYNWRKNFRLDDNDDEVERNHQDNKDHENEEQKARDQLEEEQDSQDRYQEEDQDPYLYSNEENGEDVIGEPLDPRRYSLGGESITLFSRSPVREILSDVPEELPLEEEPPKEQPEETVPIEEEFPVEKPKKKKSKKKLRKGSKTEEELRDDNDSDTQMGYTRRRDDQEVAEPPKRKSRSRRSSKSSLTNEEANGGSGLFSPRSSLAFVGDSLEGIAEFERDEEQSSSTKKKTKKRKKTSTKESREEAKEEPHPTEESHLDQALAAALAEIAPVSVSTNLTPESTQQNLLSIISTGQSVCITPASSVEEIVSTSTIATATASPSSIATTVASAAVVPARSVVDTFDILKDANFYPLF